MVAKEVQKVQVKATPDFDVSGGVCPEDAEMKKGTVIECTIEIEGTEAPYSVTFTEVGDDSAHFDILPAKAIISTATVVEFLQQNAVDQGLGKVEVDCGDAILVQDPESTFVCTMTRGDAAQDITMLIEDIDGKVSIQS